MHKICKDKNNDSLYRYTNNQRAKEMKSRKITKLRLDAKPELLNQWKTYLSKCLASTVDVTKFSEHFENKI